MAADEAIRVPPLRSATIVPLLLRLVEHDCSRKFPSVISKHTCFFPLLEVRLTSDGMGVTGAVMVLGHIEPDIALRA